MRKSEAALLVFAILVPMFAFMGVLIAWSIKQQKKRRSESLRKIAESFGTPTFVTDARSASTRQIGEAFETDLDGHRYRIFAFLRGKYEYVEIQLVTDANLPLVVFRPENGRDRLGRVLFLNRELQLDDKEFDDTVYIESDERDEYIKDTLAEPAMRNAVLDAVRAGHAVTLSKHGVSMVIPISWTAPPKEQIEQRIGFLKELAKGVRNVEGASGTWTGARGDKLIIGLYFGLVVTYLSMMVIGVIDSARFEPLHAEGQKLPYRVGGLGLVAFFVLAFFYVRGHSRSLRNFFLLLFPAIFVFPFAPSILMWSANAGFDSAPTSTTRAAVTEVYKQKNGKTTNYRVRLAVDADQPQPQYLSYKKLSLIIPYATWKTLAVGDHVNVTVHKGAFDWPWIGPVEKAP